MAKESQKMKTIEIEIAMMAYLNVRQNLIVPNTHWGLYLGNKAMHECDLLMLTKSGYATEIEIKVSKSDLLNDNKKLHFHSHEYITKFYFAVPDFLEEVALTSIPDHAGLFVLKYKKDGSLKVTKRKDAFRSKASIKWNDKERYQLARLGAMRILGLKKKLL